MAETNRRHLRSLETSRRHLRSLDRIFEDIFQLEGLSTEAFRRMTEASKLLLLMRNGLR